MRNSILTNTDSYKVSMWKQYPSKWAIYLQNSLYA